MYTPILIVHSWLRWAVLLAGLAASIEAFTPGREGRGSRLSLVFIACLDLQLLLGLLLHVWLSPITAMAFADVGAAMRVASLRFWAVEHVTLMVAAVVFAHVGRIVARKGGDRGRVAFLFAVSLILMIVGTPWPGRSHGRPLFRF